MANDIAAKCILVNNAPFRTYCMLMSIDLAFPDNYKVGVLQDHAYLIAIFSLAINVAS